MESLQARDADTWALTRSSNGGTETRLELELSVQQISSPLC
jgi:hypothetical protein